MASSREHRTSDFTYERWDNAIVGRNQKLTSDPELAKPHEAGANLAAIQILTHARFGAIAYFWPRFWVLHYTASQGRCEQLQLLHEELEQQPVSPQNMRLLADMQFLQQVYESGTSMLSEVVRTVQHFAEELERVTRAPLTGSTVEDRLSEAVANASLPIDKSSQGYAAFSEMVRLRDAVEHPKPTNTYAGEPGQWDRVPLAWLLSDRSLTTFERYIAWFDELAKAWEIAKASYDRPAELQIERGIKSELQYKKPPST